MIDLLHPLLSGENLAFSQSFKYCVRLWAVNGTTDFTTIIFPIFYVYVDVAAGKKSLDVYVKFGVAFF